MKSVACPGWLAFVMGWMPRETGKSTQIPWSANIFLFVGLAFLMRGHTQIALLLGVIGSLAALTVFSLVADPTAGIESLRWGCYIWLASLFTFAIGTGYICIKSSILEISHAEKGKTQGESFRD